MKIILIKNVKYGYESVKEIDDFFKTIEFYTSEDSFPVSEVAEVEFKMLDREDLVSKEIAVLDKQIVKLRGDAEAAITSIEGKKQELLALPGGDDAE